MSGTRWILLAVPDVFFAAKIQTAAAHLGLKLGDTTPARLADDCRRLRPDLVIVDLHAPGGVLDAIRGLKRDAELQAVPVIGFYSHVDDAVRRAALEAGVDRVMPRSAFTLQLSSLLQGGD